MKRLEKITSFGKYFLVLTLIFSIGFVSAAATLDDLHLNIQTTDAQGKVVTGSFDFRFDITTDEACTNTVYTKSANLETDVRGIISYYLDATDLDYDQQYYLCYYRDGALIETMQVARAPYAFRAKYVNVSGIEVDSNLDLGNYNLSAAHIFGDGSGLSGIDAAQIDMSNFYNASQSDFLFVPYTGANKAIDLGGQNISANYFIGDGRYLTNLDISALDMSAYYLKTNLYNKSEIDSGFIPYIGANSNVNLGSQNMTAQYYFGSGRYLTDLNVDEMDLSDYYKKTEVYNKGETFNQSEIATFLGNVVPYIGATGNVNLGSQNISAGYFIGDGSRLTNLDISALDMSAYYTKNQVYNKTESVPYIGANSNVNLGSQNMTAQYYFGSGRYLTDLDVNALDLSEYYKKVQVYNQSEADSKFVSYIGANSNLDMGANDITAAHFIGDGSQLTNINASAVNYWGKNGDDLYYNDGDVGIGTDSPESKLHISGLGEQKIIINSKDHDKAGLTLLREGSAYYDWNIINDGGNLLFQRSIDDGNSWTTNVYFGGNTATNGNVGIGVANPSEKLHIYDALNSASLKVEVDGSDDDAEILIDRASNNRRANLKFTTGDTLDWSVGTMYNEGNANSDFSISTSNNLANAALTINPSGQIGIGDNTPDSTLKLDVEGNIGAQAICDENGANCVDVSTITANVLENPVVGFFSHAVIFSMDYSGAGTYEATLTASHDFCSGGYYLGVIKKDGSRQLISTPFGGDCTTVSLDSTNTEPAKYLVWNHADDRFYWRINSASITADEQVVGYYYYGTNKFQWLVKTNPFRFPQTNHLNMGGNNIALNGGYLSGDGGDEGIAVDSDGNVGIGTTNPGAKLQIMDDGDATIKLSRLNGDQYLTLTGGNGGTQMIKSAYDLELSTHASDKDILLMPTGNVGIGTTNPSKTLEVKGEINVSNSEVSMYMDGGALIIEG